ncbi:GTP pyrophosphokinase family protein [Micromonospora purpureochromogenes]|uniref:GTP pyrophosphokinase n=1 Tax=Micromonospora purpureochromogenes TaxID=47872 RepID=UPI00362FC605
MRRDEITEPTSDPYAEATSDLDRFGALIAGLITALLDEADISFLNVSYRVKTRGSASRKLAKGRGKYADYKSLHDLLGIRVITYFNDEVDRVGELLQAQFAVDAANSVDKRQLLDAREFGYLSLHYVLTLDEKRRELPEYRRYVGIPFEIQIRSVLQHAWAEIEHDLGYKSAQSLPPKLQRHFARLASLLESADDGFVALRDQITQSEHEAVSEVTQSPKSPLTPLTALAVITKNPVARGLDEYVSELLNSSLEGGGYYTSEPELEWLRQMGIETIEDFEQAYVENAETVKRYARKWINKDHRRGTVERGISVWYLEMTLLAKMPQHEQEEVFQRYGTVPPEQKDRALGDIRATWAAINRTED